MLLNLSTNTIVNIVIAIAILITKDSDGKSTANKRARIAIIVPRIVHDLELQ